MVVTRFLALLHLQAVVVVEQTQEMVLLVGLAVVAVELLQLQVALAQAVKETLVVMV
jgi:hypothetical protein